MKTFPMSSELNIRKCYSTVFIALSMLLANCAVALEVVITFPNGKEQKATLEKMADDGSITIKVEGGTTVYKRDQYAKVVSNEMPSEISTADQQFKAKDYAGALRNYQTAYDKYKWLNWGEAAYEKIGDCQRSQGENEKALETYDKFLKQYPRSTNIYRIKYSMGLAYRSVGKNEESLKAFNEVADITDDIFTVYALSNIGELQFGQGEYEQALRSFLKIVVLYDGVPQSDAKVKEAKSNAAKCYDKIIEKTSSEKDREMLQQEKERILR